MNNLRSVFSILLIYSLAGCAGNDQRYNYPMPGAADYPEWVFKGSGSFEEAGKVMISGVGIAGGIRNVPLARQTAANRARSEVAKVMEVYSASLMKDYMASTTAGDGSGSAEEQHVEQAIKTFSAASLQGVTIPDFWYGPDGTVYARAVLDFSLLPDLAKKGQLDAAVTEYVRDNAKKSFDDLEKVEACHRVPGQPPRPAVDILFVIDNSGSMSQEQANLGRNFESFFNNLSGSDLDFQVGVVTTDVDRQDSAGRFRGDVAVLKPDTADLKNVFANAVAVGVSGSTQERGLEALRLALSAPNFAGDGSGPNDGFLRDGARLAIIIVSDEDDQSPLPVSQYTAFLSQLKGGLKKINFASLVGLEGGCMSQNGSAGAGTRYIETTRTFGEYGIVESICQDDFAKALEQISGEISEATSRCK